ncbi:hypothetical protein Ddc_15829 [Ditylenchus destructor]|nr:hypothetical protein Ddc_15829 [Ditylenchus destructor]
MNGMSKVEHFPQHSQDSELQPLVRRNDVWSPLGYDTKIDVFKFLRPYDIRKLCVYVNKSWASFCVDNEKYIPCPAPLCTVKQFPKTPNLLSSSELEAKRQRRQQARHRLILSSLALLAVLLTTWSCIVYLIVKINNQSEEDCTDDLLAFCPLMVLSLLMTYRYMKDCCYYNEEDPTDDLLALCFFMVLSLSKTYRYLTDCYHDECCMPRMPWGAGLWGYGKLSLNKTAIYSPSEQICYRNFRQPHRKKPQTKATSLVRLAVFPARFMLCVSEL